MMQKEGAFMFKSANNLQVKARISKAEKVLVFDFKSEAHGSELKRYKLAEQYLFIQSANQESQIVIQLSMKVKFEIISLLLKDKRKIVGFRIFFNDNKSNQFYSTAQETLKEWIEQLKKRCVLKGFNQYFRHYNKIGKGGFSIIYEVQRMQDSTRFAAKSLLKKKFIESDQLDLLQNQLRVMRQMNHKNVLSMEGIYETENTIYIVTDLLPGGDLQKRIEAKNGPLQAQQTKQIMHGILQGINYIHNKKIIHRDLKPDNIMFRSNQSNDPIIIDLGLATSIDDKQSLLVICGTFGYISPEIMQLPQETDLSTQQILQEYPLGPACDIFAIGAMFHLMLTGKNLIDSDQCFENLFKNKKLNLKATKENYSLIDKAAYNLMEKMLVYDPNQRISAEQALKHPYFN